MGGLWRVRGQREALRAGFISIVMPSDSHEERATSDSATATCESRELEAEWILEPDGRLGVIWARGRQGRRGRKA